MTLAPDKPDLDRIAESAFKEVLQDLLSLSATSGNSADTTLSHPPDPITSLVQLIGQRFSGSVCVQLPQDFAAHAVHLLVGVDGRPEDATAMLDDAAGEITNMVAGRIAAQLAVDGHPITLGTPSISRRPRLPSKCQSEDGHGRVDLTCAGHWLSLDIQCRCPQSHDAQNPEHR